MVPPETAVCGETERVEAFLPLTPPAAAARRAKAAGSFQQLKFSKQLKCMEGLHLVASRSSRQPAGMTRTLPFLCHWALQAGWGYPVERLQTGTCGICFVAAQDCKTQPLRKTCPRKPPKKKKKQIKKKHQTNKKPKTKPLPTLA